MRPISTRLHGVLDYLTGATLVAAPSVLGLDGGSPTARLLRVAGAGHAVYSTLTNYGLGLVRLVPMRAHLIADAVGALGLVAAPWLLGTAGGDRREWLPPLAFGLYELAAVALTDPDT